VGKNKYIETPEKMWELFTAYKAETKKNPFLEHDFVGKDGAPAYREKQRCLTMEGFELYCMEHSQAQGIDQYFSNQNKIYNEFVGICTRVRKEIRRDQIEGGMAGIYNPSITQRLNGLKEQTENQNFNTEVKAEFGTGSTLSSGETPVK
jgi:hypothetical protein